MMIYSSAQSTNTAFANNEGSHVWNSPESAKEDAPDDDFNSPIVTEGQLLTTMRFSSVLGVCCLVLFGILNAIFKMYRIRLSLRRVTIKPPALPKWHWSMIWVWIWKAISVSDEVLLQTAGLDAFMFIKVFALAIQLFFPMAIIGCCILIPIHQSGDYTDRYDRVERNRTNGGAFVRMTASNVKPASSKLWVHCICVYIFILYTLLLLDWHLKRYVRLRHQYLSSGSQSNMWRRKIHARPEKKLDKKRPILRSMILRAASFFREDVSGEELKKGLLSKVATMRRDEVDNIFGDGAETPQQHVDSQSCRSIPDQEDYQALIDKELREEKSHKSLLPEIGLSQTSLNEISEDVELPRRTQDTSSIVEAAHYQAPASCSNRRHSLPNVSEERTSAVDYLGIWKQNSTSKNRQLIKRIWIVMYATENVAIWKWWFLTDGHTEIHSDNANRLPDDIELPRPSVRHLKTVNTRDAAYEEEIAVNAQQYCVLLTNFPALKRLRMKKELDSATHDRNLLSKIFQWFFGDIAVDRVFLGSHILDRIHNLGFFASSPIEGVKCSEKDRDVGTSRSPRLSFESVDSSRLDEATAGQCRGIREESNIVAESFHRLFPDDFVNALPIRNHKSIDKLIYRWDAMMGTLERHQEYEDRTGNSSKISQSRWWSFLFFCKLGYKNPILAVPHYLTQIKKLEQQMEAERAAILSREHAPSWIIIFKTQKAAAIASQALLHSESGDMCVTEPAPGPDEINWQALWKTRTEKTIRVIVVAPIITVLLAVPLGFFAGFLSNVTAFFCDDNQSWQYWHGYCEKKDYQKFITGWLPPILVSIWQNLIMPNALYYLVQASATCASLSQLERNIAHLFFVWDVFTIYLGAIVGGTLVTKINAILKRPADLMDALGVALPASSNFFVNYVILRAFFLVPYQLLLPHPGVLKYLLKLGGKFGMAPTARDRAILWAPRSVRYGREYGLILLMFLITLGYSVISPIIVPIALIYFILSWTVWRYQILYVYVRKYESGGRMWPTLVKRLLFSLWLFQFLTSCALIAKEAYYQAAILWVTVPVILRRFYVYCNQRFEPGLSYIPLEMAHYAPPAIIDSKVYTPPALLKNCAGWHPDYMKAWEGWPCPAYTL